MNGGHIAGPEFTRQVRQQHDADRYPDDPER